MSRYLPLQRWQLVLTVVLTLSSTAAGVVYWRSEVVRKQSLNRYARAERLIAEGKSVEALEIIGVEERVVGFKEGKDPESRRWRQLKQTAITRTANAAGLEELDTHHPDEVLADERASLLLFRAKALQKGKDNRATADTLVKTWAPKTKHPEWWLAAQADVLIAQGKVEAAITLLQSRTFKGDTDVNRLLRLALLTGGRNQQRAWAYIQQAYALAPRNPEVRGFRAQLLESVDKLPEARVEYAAAWLADTKNPVSCDRLAEFYRRHGDLTDAVQTWADGLSSGANADFLQTKALFWSRVAEPTVFPILAKKKDELPPPGPLQALARYLHDLPNEAFWDADKFDELVNARRFEKDRQEVYWLTLLRALQLGQERRALSLIAHNPFRDDSWNPMLERALDLTLSYRLTGQFEATAHTLPQPNATDQHTFLGELEKATQGHVLSQETKAFLKSENAFAGIVLASGWMEAALRLNQAKSAVAVPEWYSYGLLQAMRHNRDNNTALVFAQTLVHPTPALDVLVAEMLVNANKIEEALSLLERHAADQNDAGYRAAWLLATAYMDQNRPIDAIRTIENQPTFARSEHGIALKARAALAVNDLAQAKNLYTSIRSNSGEAKLFLAKQAFDRGDYAEARRLTEELLQLYPDALELRANLRTIEERQQQAPGRSS